MSSRDTKQIISNIILETKTETLDSSKKAAISDKNNRSQAPIQDLTKPEEYNVANPNIAESQGRGGEATYIPQKEIVAEEEEKKKQEERSKDKAEIVVKKQKTKSVKASQGGGETAPTLFDVKKRPIINLYNTGAATFATKSKSYAEYFFNMRKKIEKYHKAFFPVYQYYQGLLKNGEVVVEYSLNQNGDIVEANVIGSYGSETVDKASLNSIVYAKNFGPLPEDFKDQPGITVRFHFIYMAK